MKVSNKNLDFIIDSLNINNKEQLRDFVSYMDCSNINKYFFLKGIKKCLEWNKTTNKEVILI